MKDDLFGSAGLLGQPEKSIALQTRRGNDIPNVVEIPATEEHQHKDELLFRKHGSFWKRRKPATGVYNCAGHVWASRRTSILSDDAWDLIYADDGYRRLGQGEEPLPGDLVVFIDTDSGERLHIARVAHLAPPITEGGRRVPWAISKWNSTSGEFLHNVYDHPYPEPDFTIRREYWSDRPRG